MHVYDLRCEYEINPLGIGTAAPRLFWKMQADRRGVRQTAYQVLVATQPDRLTDTAADVWNSGKVESDQSVHNVYAGPTLTSRQRVYWSVRAWDEYGAPTGFAETAWWEMGLLTPDDWRADWIGSSLVGSPRATVPVPYLRKAFEIDGPIMHARLYITALGVYHAEINSQPITNTVLNPGWTDYRQRVMVQTYDVTELLSPGKNVIGAMLGDGWFCGHVAERQRQFYGDRPRLLAQLHVDFADGTTQIVLSDETWRTATGPLIESDLIMGESYDARRALPGWSTPTFDDATWLSVAVFDAPDITLDAQLGPPIRRMEEIEPIADPTPFPIMWNRTSWIFDLGQNMVGWVRLKIQGERGTTIRLRYAEMLNADGSLHVENLRTARATDYYTLSGDGIEIYEPTFTFHGFRYVEVDTMPGEPVITHLTRDTITGIVVHSDMPPTGSFACSNPLINQLQHNIIWGQKGNFLSIPTDCPQRDERMGWLGDAQIFAPTAALNMDVAGFFTKWLQDIADAQLDDGRIPGVVPNLDLYGINDGGPGWADGFIICAWTIYQAYGDTRLLEQHYDGLVAFIDHLECTSPGLIRCHPDVASDDWTDGVWHGWGDWLSHNANTPDDLIGTAYFAHSVRLMVDIANVLGHNQDEARFKSLFEAIRDAFGQRFITPDGLITGRSQTSYVLALVFDLVPDDLRATIVEQLTADIQARGMHLSTGFLGTPHLLKALSNAGQTDIAYALLTQTTFPSWLYSVLQGATTIWERWDAWTHDQGFQKDAMNSFNHYAYGAVGAWLYAQVAGIQHYIAGYKDFVLHPQTTGPITQASGQLTTLYGTITSEWQRTDHEFDWQINIPANTRATVYVPCAPGDVVTESDHPIDRTLMIPSHYRTADHIVVDVESGHYHFRVLAQGK